MNPDERKLMIAIGSAVTDLQKQLLPAIEALTMQQNSFYSKSPADSIREMPKSLVNPADVVHVNGRPGHPSVISSVEHDRGPGLHKFQMDIVFDNAADLSPQLRMDTSVALLSELEEILREYKVRSLKGTYGIQ